MSETETETDGSNANGWMEYLQSFRHCKLLWESTAERENIVEWARDTLTRGTYEIFNLFISNDQPRKYGRQDTEQKPFCVAFCTNDDAIAVQFRLTFPHLTWGEDDAA